VELEQSRSADLKLIEPSYRNSARNLIHYLSLRQRDVRELQRNLAALGLSSLGVLEATLWQA
jgi:pyruvate kinase